MYFHFIRYIMPPSGNENPCIAIPHQLVAKGSLARPARRAFELEWQGGRRHLQSSEEIVDQNYKLRGQSNVDKRDLVINKTGLKGNHLRHMHRNKKVPIGMVSWGKLTPILWNQHDWDTSLTCLYTNVWSLENKWEELEAWLLFAGLQSHHDHKDAAGWLTQLKYYKGQI